MRQTRPEEPAAGMDFHSQIVVVEILGEVGISAGVQSRHVEVLDGEVEVMWQADGFHNLTVAYLHF